MKKRFLSVALLAAVAFTPGFDALAEVTKEGEEETRTAAVTSPADELATWGPGIPKESFRQDELFQVLGVVNSDLGVRHGHSLLALHRGYLVVVGSRDGGRGDGNFAFYDLSDIRRPKLVAKYDGPETHNLREAHSFGFTRVEDRDVVVLLARDGLQFWDWTDVNKARRLSELRLLPMHGGDYAGTPWWLALQGPYVYVGGTDSGLHIVDATDPAKPRRVAQVPVSQTGGFRIGPVFAVGNLLVLSSMDLPGISTLDIQDPVRPRLLATVQEGVGYSSLFNGGRLYAVDTVPKVWDLSEPGKIRLMSKYRGPILGSKGGYGLYQDGYLHQGVSNNYAKVDFRDPTRPKLVGKVRSGVKGSDLDGATVLGNFALASCDHSKGSFIAPHATEADSLGPKVTWVDPVDGATDVEVTARVGLTLSDQVDPGSVGGHSIIVREVGGEALRGRYSSQTGVVNFWPQRPLKKGATYEIVVPQGGLRDYAGNPTEETFHSRFSAGEAIGDLRLSIVPAPPSTVGEVVSLRVAAPIPQASTLYSWDFGDGSEPTPFSSQTAVQHRYAEPGHFAVVLRARQDRRLGGTSVIHTVHWLPTAAGPSHSSTVVLDEDRGRVWNVNPDNDSVTASDLAGLRRLFEIEVAKHPRTLARDLQGRIWVVSQDDPTVTVLDGEDGGLEARIPLRYGSRPYGIAVAPHGRHAFVATQGSGEVMRIDTATRTLDGTVTVGGKLRGVAVAADGKRVWVTRFLSPAARGELFELDAEKLEVRRRIDLAMDPGPDREDSGRGVPNYLTSLTLTPDGRRLWLPFKKDNTQRGLTRDGERLSFESTVRTAVSQVDVGTGQEVAGTRRDLNDRDLATAVVLSPLGDYAFVATQGTHTVEILDAYDGRTVSSIQNTGLAPQGLALTRDGKRLVVHNFMSRTLAVYDTGGMVEHFERPARKLGELETVSEEKLPPGVLLGKQVFYNAYDLRMNRDGYISCASCHLDGGHDGRVWDFSDRGEGLRNTIELNGRGGLDHGRLHWSANFDEVQDFEHDIRGPFGGAGFLADPDFQEARFPLVAPKAGKSPELDALASYLTSLKQVPASPFRNPDGTLTADGVAGRALFFELRCFSCHGGRELTDSKSGVLHDVGTLERPSGRRLGGVLLGLDTPTLRGVWDTAPYLHDGTAATLMEVLTKKSSRGKHGNGAHLSARQREQLVSYLKQIDDREEGAPASPPDCQITSVQVLDQDTARPEVRVTVSGTGLKAPSRRIPRKLELYAADASGNPRFLPIATAKKVPYTFRFKEPLWPETVLVLRTHFADGSRSTSPEVRVSLPSLEVSAEEQEPAVADAAPPAISAPGATRPSAP